MIIEVGDTVSGFYFGNQVIGIVKSIKLRNIFNHDYDEVFVSVPGYSNLMCFYRCQLNFIDKAKELKSIELDDKTYSVCKSCHSTQTVSNICCDCSNKIEI